jgi:hypothetical protein
MATTFLKRQKEMKRLEKQREKAARRAQKKLAKGAQSESSAENITSADIDASGVNTVVPSQSEPHN